MFVSIKPKMRGVPVPAIIQLQHILIYLGIHLASRGTVKNYIYSSLFSSTGLRPLYVLLKISIL